MDISDSLFDAVHICLAPMQPEKDAIVNRPGFGQWNMATMAYQAVFKRPTGE